VGVDTATISYVLTDSNLDAKWQTRGQEEVRVAVYSKLVFFLGFFDPEDGSDEFFRTVD
jgi:hypothetical protein